MRAPHLLHHARLDPPSPPAEAVRGQGMPPSRRPAAAPGCARPLETVLLGLPLHPAAAQHATVRSPPPVRGRRGRHPGARRGPPRSRAQTAQTLALGQLQAGSPLGQAAAAPAPRRQVPSRGQLCEQAEPPSRLRQSDVGLLCRDHRAREYGFPHTHADLFARISRACSRSTEATGAKRRTPRDSAYPKGKTNV